MVKDKLGLLDQSNFSPEPVRNLKNNQSGTSPDFVDVFDSNIWADFPDYSPVRKLQEELD